MSSKKKNARPQDNIEQPLIVKDNKDVNEVIDITNKSEVVEKEVFYNGSSATITDPSFVHETSNKDVVIPSVNTSVSTEEKEATKDNPEIPKTVVEQPKVTVKKPSNKEKVVGRWRLCIVKTSSPIRWIQIQRKIKSLGISCEIDEKNRSIYSSEFGRRSDALAFRKELQKKGFSPSIEEV